MSDIIERLQGSEILDALLELADEAVATIQMYVARYDDALKRINDLEAELEFLRNELARKQ